MKTAFALVLGVAVACIATGQQASAPDRKPADNVRQTSSSQTTPPKKPQPQKGDQKAAQVPSGVSSSTGNATGASVGSTGTADSTESTVVRVDNPKPKSTKKKSAKKVAETPAGEDSKPK